jgi:hypothetical protein
MDRRSALGHRDNRVAGIGFVKIRTAFFTAQIRCRYKSREVSRNVFTARVFVLDRRLARWLPRIRPSAQRISRPRPHGDRLEHCPGLLRR